MDLPGPIDGGSVLMARPARGRAGIGHDPDRLWSPPGTGNPGDSTPFEAHSSRQALRSLGRQITAGAAQPIRWCDKCGGKHVTPAQRDVLAGGHTASSHGVRSQTVFNACAGINHLHCPTGRVGRPSSVSACHALSPQFGRGSPLRLSWLSAGWLTIALATTDGRTRSLRGLRVGHPGSCLRLRRCSTRASPRHIDSGA